MENKQTNYLTRYLEEKEYVPMVPFNVVYKKSNPLIMVHIASTSTVNSISTIPRENKFRKLNSRWYH